MEHVVSHALLLGVHRHPVGYDDVTFSLLSTYNPSDTQNPSAINITSPASACSLPHCAGSSLEMHPASIPSGCEECVAECDVETCDLGAGSSQCTDHCLVVPCEDPCPDVCVTECIPLFDSPCETLSHQGFQDFPDHCPELSYQVDGPSTSLPTRPLQQHQTCGVTSHPDWNNVSLSRELDALICACATQSQPHSFDCNTCDPRLLSNDKSNTQSRHYHSSIPRPLSGQTLRFNFPTLASLSPTISVNSSARSSPDASSTSTPTSDTNLSQPFDSPENKSRGGVRSYQSQPSDNLLCLWAECRKSFHSSQDLISHVNATHLHLHPGSSPRQISSPESSQSPVLQCHPRNVARRSPTSVSCLWGDCNAYPSPSHIAGTSVGNVTDDALGLLASHLLQDHLGVSILPHAATFGPVHPEFAALTGESRTKNVPGSLLPHVADVSPSSSPSFLTDSIIPSSLSDLTRPALRHHCKWKLCLHAQVAFSSSADLTKHITDVHVGGGKNRYDCMWDDCNRQGSAGFSSKQKILRHVQSHTGHRPFRCKLCDQFFSEAATLQQHMRRHTKEKPYVCDFPGCKKAFAITGALTIHKRTHSGKKPFKCTYCDRSFSESSNLSKHVRTHTGDRPYPCSYPGCKKRFARPDQVSRHMNVHNKQRQPEDLPVETDIAQVGDGNMDESTDVPEMGIEE